MRVAGREPAMRVGLYDRNLPRRKVRAGDFHGAADGPPGPYGVRTTCSLTSRGVIWRTLELV